MSDASRASAIAAAARLAGRPGRVLLHSGSDLEGCGRHSFVASDPTCVLKARAGRTWLVHGGPGAEAKELAESPFVALERLAAEHGAEEPAEEGGPQPIAIGTLGYDGSLWFGFYPAVLRFDHEAATCALVGRDVSARLRLAEALAAVSHGPGPAPLLSPLGASAEADLAYLGGVVRAKEYIAAGDVYQVNLSRRLLARVLVPGDPLALYQQLATRAPVPYGALLETDEAAILCGSPERFLHRAVAGGRLETRPIKGTRARGASVDGDAALLAELLGDDKERAEHLMIVDLERNDLGRIAEVGSVRVDDYRRVLSTDSVHHLVSTISCQPRASAGLSDILAATFPGGSITGAPKRRAMEIIAELEPSPRGLYTGCIGYLGAGGGFDLAIAIRTLVMDARRCELAVGGGIVWDSDVAREYLETEEKAHGWRLALASPGPLPMRNDILHSRAGS